MNKLVNLFMILNWRVKTGRIQPMGEVFERLM